MHFLPSSQSVIVKPVGPLRPVIRTALYECPPCLPGNEIIPSAPDAIVIPFSGNLPTTVPSESLAVYVRDIVLKLIFCLTPLCGSANATVSTLVKNPLFFNNLSSNFCTVPPCDSGAVD